MRSGARAGSRVPDVPSRAFCLTRAHLNSFCARPSPYASASHLRVRPSQSFASPPHLSSRAPSSLLLARLPSIVRFAHSAFAPFGYFSFFPNKGRYVTKKSLFRDASSKRTSLQVNTLRIMPVQGTVRANGCPFRATRHSLICYKPPFFGNIAQMRDGDRTDTHEKGNRGEGGAKTKEQRSKTKRERGGRGQEKGRAKRARKQVRRKGAARKTRRAKRQNE